MGLRNDPTETKAGNQAGACNLFVSVSLRGRGVEGNQDCQSEGPGTTRPAASSGF